MNHRVAGGDEDPASRIRKDEPERRPAVVSQGSSCIGNFIVSGWGLGSSFWKTTSSYAMRPMLFATMTSLPCTVAK